MPIEEGSPQRAPELGIAGLAVWILDREFESAEDYWDGNWLLVLAECRASGAVVQATGAILHLSQIRKWLNQLKPLYDQLTGKAVLGGYEPNLAAAIELNDGRGTVVVDITPDHLTQHHQFVFPIDQSHLPELISALERLLDQYPMRGSQTN